VTDIVRVVELVPQAYVSMIQGVGEINFTLHQLLNAAVVASIYDISGNLVWTYSGVGNSGMTINAPTSSFAAGLYNVLILVDQKPVLSTKVLR
jgi:hypothetical protein